MPVTFRSSSANSRGLNDVHQSGPLKQPEVIARVGLSSAQFTSRLLLRTRSERKATSIAPPGNLAPIACTRRDAMQEALVSLIWLVRRGPACCSFKR